MMTMFMEGARVDSDEAARAAAQERLQLEVAILDPTKQGARQAIALLGRSGIHEGFRSVLEEDAEQVIAIGAVNRRDRADMLVMATVQYPYGIREHTYSINQTHRPNARIKPDGTEYGQFSEPLIAMLGKIAQANDNPGEIVGIVQLGRTYG